MTMTDKGLSNIFSPLLSKTFSPEADYLSLFHKECHNFDSFSAVKDFFSEVTSHVYHIQTFFLQRIQNKETLDEILSMILDELYKVFQSMIQTSSSSHWRKEDNYDSAEKLENIKMLIQENKNVFNRVCSVLKSIQILRENISVFNFNNKFLRNWELG